ncbi:unnamed protein product [Orchesella dallaii]|uniref:Uncharacterized protein n=1 Tax=Orchesella dallaii TaxID=48710 RepID=A0ABP1S5F0_9HEXA
MTLVHWIGNLYFCEFLNGWPKFITKFEEAFKPYYKLQSNLTRKRNIFLFIWITPAVIFFFLTNAINFMTDDISPLVSEAFSRFITFYVVGVRSICYVKDYILLQSLQMAYEQVATINLLVKIQHMLTIFSLQIFRF